VDLGADRLADIADRLTAAAGECGLVLDTRPFAPHLTVGRTDGVRLGPSAALTRAAAAEGLRVSINEDALIKGSFFRSDHFPFARAGVPALSLESGTDFVGRAKEWGKAQADEYTAKRYHQPSDEVLPSFSYDGALQQMRVIVRTAVAVATAKAQPTWNRGSEFRAAGEARLK
jgi:Zn-dependent M28 family amino/carboxypeptidase